MRIARFVVIGFTVLWFFLWGYFSDWDLNYMIWHHTYPGDLAGNAVTGMAFRMIAAFVLVVASVIMVIMPDDGKAK